MWFQLNTTFSTHLGALSTLQSNYGVTYSLSNFTKTTAPDMVEKDKSLTVVLTMVEGATFTSATMTDGTTSVTGTLASSDSTVTMTIAQVKGPVTVIARAASASVTPPGEEEPETPVDPPAGDSDERVYTIGETLKFNDMSEVASTFISDSYYKATDSGNPGSKLTVETRSGYKAWKNIRVYAGQSYALNPDARAICLYDADENAWAGFNLKNTYSDGIIPASVVTQDGWMSVTVTSSVSDNNCTIRRVS